ncbi:MAG: tetratricopeptide repeat protein [bacterium]
MKPRASTPGLPLLGLPLAAVAVLVLVAAVATAVGAEKGKIPITTKSETALGYYLGGRDLVERLRGQDAREYFEKAVAEDPDFAMAHLSLGLVSTTTEGFFGNLAKAKALVDRVSEGERLMILGTEAGAIGLPLKQRDYYKKLVAAYPEDERALNLLGGNYFALQDYFLAIEQYEKARMVEPEHSPTYNQLGYCRRFLGDYSGAEKAFQHYIQMIPDDPNPYDSYAELLMKMGKYDESIELYRKALAVDSNFVASRIGIASDLNFKGRHEAARAELDKLYAMARSNGERRAAHFARAVSYVDQGDMAGAVAELEKQYALAEAIGDAGAMAGDLGAMGDVLCESGKFDEALGKYQLAHKLIKESDLSDQIKSNADLTLLYTTGYVAARTGNLAEARVKAREYLKGAEALGNPNFVRLAHQLLGLIALEDKDYKKALKEFEQTSQQNPYTLYRVALAYNGAGDTAKAKEFAEQAANYNALNNMAQGYVRAKARQLAASL